MGAIMGADNSILCTFFEKQCVVNMTLIYNFALKKKKQQPLILIEQLSCCTVLLYLSTAGSVLGSVGSGRFSRSSAGGFAPLVLRSSVKNISQT